jgi:hypothetical protein
MSASDCLVTVGVDSHGDVHVAAAVDQLGRLLTTHHGADHHPRL